MDATPDLLNSVEALVDLAHPVKTDAAAWAAEALADPGLAERDRQSEFFAEGWQRCADRGIQGLTVEPGLGGQGRSRVDGLLTFEGLGYGSPDQGLVFALACQTWTVLTALDTAADDAQRERLVPGLCDGSLIGAFAMTELDSGSDAYALSCRAERTDTGYRLTGRKAYVTLGPVADFTIVFATLDPDLGRWGLTAFLVDSDAPGVDRDHPREKMGLRTTPFGDLVLDGVEVAAEDRLGAEGSGGALFNAAVEAERAYLFAVQIGQLERQLDDAVAYARDRQQFGRPIGDFQAVSHRIADMKARHEHARLLLYKTALLDELGRPSTTTSALTKLAASEGAIASGLDALRIHGAKGYLTDDGLEREVRSAIGGITYAGTSDIQKNIIARLLGVGA